MPRRKNWRRSAARRLVMGLCNSGDSDGRFVADECKEHADPEESLPFVSSQGTFKQMRVDSRPFKLITNEPSVQGTIKQTEVNSRLFKPFVRSVHEMRYEMRYDTENVTRHDIENDIDNGTEIGADISSDKLHQSGKTSNSEIEQKRVYRYQSMIHGSYNQGDTRFSIFSRGNQCTMNSLCALIYSHFTDLNTSKTLDEVLLVGDHCYKIVIEDLKRTGMFQHRLLSLDEIPDSVDILRRKVFVKKMDIVSGLAVDSIGQCGSQLPTLHTSFNTIFKNQHYVLVVIGAICSAVYKKANRFWLFDSHSHDCTGMSSCDGNSILISFENIDDLVAFLYAMYESMMIDLSCQYELLPLKFIVEDEKSNLLSDYFKDQMKKADCSTKELNRDRREYHKNYKRNQRNDPKFKRREKMMQNKAKTKARSSAEFKVKERILQNKSKNIARSTAEFKAREKLIQKKSKNAKRADVEFKVKEKLIQNKSKNIARSTAEFKAREKLIQKKSKSAKRADVEFKVKEKLIQNKSKKVARSVDNFKTWERMTQNKHRIALRNNAEFKAKERLIQQKSKNAARADVEFKVKEKLMQNKSKNVARADVEFKVKEKLIQKKSKNVARSVDKFKAWERMTQNKYRIALRNNAEYKAKEKLIQQKSKNKARADFEFKAKEKLMQNKSKVKARCDMKFKLKENVYKRMKRSDIRTVEKVKQIETKSKRNARSCIEFSLKERGTSRKAKRMARTNPLRLKIERLKKQAARLVQRVKTQEMTRDKERKQFKRKNPEFKEIEIASARKKKYGENIDACIEVFHESIKDGPQYICTCCRQTWFKESVSKANNVQISTKYFNDIKSVNGMEWICITCKTSLINKKIPKLSILNGMSFPAKPEQLQLHPLEERLISLRIPFMQIRELPRGRQYSVKGNIINVPVDIQPVVNALPIPLDENITIAVKFKKKLSYKSCAFTENVRPLRVLVALHWLKKHSPLYKNSLVRIDQDWIAKVTRNQDETTRELIEPSIASSIESNKNNNTSSSDSLEDGICDSDAKENVQENVGNIDTLVDDADLENRLNTFTFAPGEGQRPLSIYQDMDSEYLCFPTIFCGQRRKENSERLVPVSYGDIIKWELRSSDRRAANSVANIFFKLKKYQMKQINDKVNLAVRRCQLKDQKLTAGQARDSHFMDNMVKHDEGYYIFKQLRNSPAYLETKKKDVFAMIRQLGLPTWFMSLSSADTRWSDLLRMLSNLNDGVDLSDEQVMNMTWEKKIKLIQKDPVTCSRYFDHRVQQFIYGVLKSSHDCLGHLTDFFYRVEFQQRGSPHIHMLIWIENAPKYKSASSKEVTEFVDTYLKCSSNDENLQDLLQLQLHKHSRTCHKKKDRICRFGYPLPPLRNTIILEPLDSDVDKYKKMYEKVQTKMNAEKDGFDTTYEKFLSEILEINEDDYIKCIRSSLKAAKVYLKRTPKDIRLNLYNENMLKAWKANIDIQFVLDPYACAMYIVSYISKSQRGMSSLLHAAAKEARDGNLDIKKQVRHIGNVFSNSVEVSAQEAVYLLLQMPLTRSSRDVVFVNTSEPNQRIQLLKAKSALDELPDSSTDVVADNVIKRYSRRPRCLENWCLADYISQLEVIYPKESTENDERDVNDDDYDDHTDKPQDFKDDQTIIVLKNGIKIRKRQNHKVIRYVHFNKKSDEDNHFREKLMLFLPWRNEAADLLGNHPSYKQHYNMIKNQIDMKAKFYEHHVEELEMAREAAEDDCNSYDDIAPMTQQAEAEAEAEGSSEAKNFMYFNPDRAVQHREYDIGIELGNSASVAAIDVTDNLMPDDKYRDLLRCLNQKQKHFFNHVIHWLKTKETPLYTFLTGGAGVGKSIVIKALYQTLYRYYNLSEGQNPDEKRVLLCAYTGKAAYNISGSTISTAFHQKFKQKDQTLNCDTLNTFRSKYRNLSVVIIDEISMVSNSMLQFIDQRLQQLTGTHIPFGGKSIIAVGDLYQLKPVAGSWIFEDLRSDAGPLCPNLWQKHFRMFELSEIMRQQNGSAFADLLNRLRLNELTDLDKVQLKQCQVKHNSENYPSNAPHIFAENSFMQDFNNKIMNRIDAQKIEILCHDSVVGANISQDRQNIILNRLASDTNITMGLHHSVTVVVDMIYDLTVNLDTEDGLTNGASCIVKKIENKLTETSRPSIIWVLFDDKRAGVERRNKYYSRGFYHGSIDQSWTPIFDIERTFQYRQNTIQRIQFPLQPAAGRTVHRAQGTTLDEVVIDLSQRRVRKNPHIHYVALSRVRSIENLHILNFNEESLSMDQRVSEEMKRLKSEAMLDLCYTPLDTISSKKHFKIVYNNCRSLHKHYVDIEKDQNILSAHVIGVSETRLTQRDSTRDYEIPGFQLIRNDQDQQSETTRPPHGLAIYIKDDVKVLNHYCFSTQSFEFVAITVKYMNEERQVVAVYKSPKLSLHNLVKVITNELAPNIDSKKKCVIVGDFNIDMSKCNKHFVNTMRDLFDCQQLISQATTDHGATLDLVFSNHPGCSGIIQAYWSDHNLVYFYT